jgi:hypothetical protein
MPFRLAELYTQPTESNLLSIMTAIQTADNGWIPGYRVVGIDPDGIATRSEFSADRMIGNTPPGGVVKAGNVNLSHSRARFTLPASGHFFWKTVGVTRYPKPSPLI